MTDVYVRGMSRDHEDGGPVEVFSSEEKAKASVPHVMEWRRESDGSLYEVTSHRFDDAWEIYKRTIDAPA